MQRTISKKWSSFFGIQAALNGFGTTFGIGSSIAVGAIEKGDRMTEYEKNIFKEYLHNKSKIIQFKIIVYIVFINVYFILRVNVGDRLMWIDVLFIIIEVLLLLLLIAFSKKCFEKNVFQAIEKKQMMLYSGIICDKKIENKARTTPDYVCELP